MKICDYCGNETDFQITLETPDLKVCEPCYKDHVTKCFECEEEDLTECMQKVENGNKTVCLPCYNEVYKKCFHCEEIFHEEMMKDYGIHTLCLECYEESCREYGYPIDDYGPEYSDEPDDF